MLVVYVPTLVPVTLEVGTNVAWYAKCGVWSAVFEELCNVASIGAYRRPEPRSVGNRVLTALRFDSQSILSGTTYCT